MTDTPDIAKIERWLAFLEAQAAFEAEVKGWADRAHSIRVALEENAADPAAPALWARLSTAVAVLSARPVDDQVYELPDMLPGDQ